MNDLIRPLSPTQPSFAAIDRCDDLDALDADIVIVGVEHGNPYPPPPGADPNAPTAADGPNAIRAASQRYGRFFTHHDIDLDGPVLDGRDLRLVDVGNVANDPDGGDANHQRTQRVVEHIRSRGGVPILLGGDDSIPIPLIRAVSDVADLCLVQFDAHLDYREEVDGIRDGWSSSMRIASTLPNISRIVHVGVRGAGSARVADVVDARAAGDVFITAREIARDGADQAATRIPDAPAYLIVFDMDVMDPAIAPGVSSIAFGGLSYWQATTLLQSIVQRGPIVGMDLAEVNPGWDQRGLTPALAARLILNTVGAIARSSQFA